LSASGSDADSDPLSWSATGLPSGVSIAGSSGTMSGTLGATSAGTYQVTVTATDSTLTANTTFTWTVGGIDLPPSTPGGLTAVVTSTSVALDWSDDTVDTDLAGYRVYRATAAAGPWTRLTSSVLGTSSFADTTAPVSVLSYYRIFAVDLAGHESTPATTQANRVIAFRGSSSVVKSKATSVAPPRPSGTSAGDTLLAVVVTADSATSTAPSGWSTVRSDAINGSLRQTVFRRTATSGEPSSYTFSVGSKTSISVLVLAYRGVSTSAIALSSGAVVSSSRSVTAPSVSTTQPGSLVVGFFGWVTTTTLGAPATYREQVRTTPSGSPSAAALAADVLQAAVGETGSQTALAASPTSGAGQLVVLQPAG
jgi:hypothetical protein